MFKNNEALEALKKNLEDKKEKITGIVKFTRQSFGFLESEEKTVFIPPHLMKKLLPNDLITASIDKEDDRESVGKIIEILDSPSMLMTGKVVENTWNEKTSLRFLSNDPNYQSLIPFIGSQEDIKKSDWVNVELSGHPYKERLFKVKRTETIGNESNPRLPWDYLRTQFDVNAYIKELKIENNLAQDKDYKDLRELPLVTIDDESAKDMDDALFAKEDDNYYYLTVAIADPSDLIFDDENQRHIITSRGFTFYLTGETIHMINREFSELEFSLMEGVDRKALCLDLKISKVNFSVDSYDFYLGLIKSSKKLSYNYVTEIIENNIVLNEDYYQSLISLYNLSLGLRAEREKLEPIFLERDEYFLEVKNYELVGIKKRTSNLANTIVEEAMILSNKTLGIFAKENNLNVLFNTNEGFQEDLKEDIELIIKDAGIETLSCSIFDSANVSHIQKELNNKIINSKSSIEKSMYEGYLSKLRKCFSRSLITNVPMPHKIMGLDLYATWTSPLRKAGDMINHLAIKSFLLNKSQINIQDSEIEKINERLEVSRRSERFLSKMLFAKLFKEKPELISKAKVISVKKFMVLLEIEGAYQYCTLQIRNIKLKNDNKVNIYTDIDEQKVIAGNKDLFSAGDVINVEFLSSNFLIQDIEVKLTV